MLVGTQYCWIEHVHPIALIGYLAIMEENQPPSVNAVDELARAKCFPTAAFRSMRLHAQLDIEHRESLYRAMDAPGMSGWSG
jgi:hypothetical protein